MTVLAYLFTALPFGIAILFALGLVALVVSTLENAGAALVLLLGVCLFETSLLGGAALNLGIWFYAADLLAVALTPALLYRLLVLRRGGDIHPAWWALGAAQAILFVWGLAQFGTSAGVDFRMHYYVWIGAAYLATFDYSEAFVQRLLKTLWWMGVGLCAIAWYRWIGAEIDPDFQRRLRMIDTTGVAFLRVIGAGPTLMLAMATLVSMYYVLTRRGGAGHGFWMILFGLTVLAMQHRSVWIATFAGIATLVIVLRRGQQGTGFKMAGMGLGLALVITLILVSGRFQGVTDSIQNQAVRGANLREGTFASRVSGWQSLLKDWAASGSPATYLIGKPFGGGYERYSAEVGGEKIGYQPHNYYVHLLYRGGLIGLISVLWLYAVAIRAAWRRWREQGDSDAVLLLAMSVALLVYYIPYAVFYPQMLVAGPLLALAGMERKRARRARLSMIRPGEVTA